MYYVVVDVGCIECGADTKVVKVCPTMEEANIEINNYWSKIVHETPLNKRGYNQPTNIFSDDSFNYFWGAEHGVQIYECE